MKKIVMRFESSKTEGIYFSLVIISIGQIDS